MYVLDHEDTNGGLDHEDTKDHENAKRESRETGTQSGKPAVPSLFSLFVPSRFSRLRDPNAPLQKFNFSEKVELLKNASTIDVTSSAASSATMWPASGTRCRLASGRFCTRYSLNLGGVMLSACLLYTSPSPRD